MDERIDSHTNRHRQREKGGKFHRDWLTERQTDRLLTD